MSLKKLKSLFQKSSKETEKKEEEKTPPLTYEIPPAQARRFAVPDIHGCNKTFQALLDRIQLTTNDQLFLLGDYIDRGPDSVGVLDTILRLKEEGYSVFPLRGNHEQMLIESITTLPRNVLLFHKEENMEGLLVDEDTVADKYKDLLLNLPYYFKT